MQPRTICVTKAKFLMHKKDKRPRLQETTHVVADVAVLADDGLLDGAALANLRERSDDRVDTDLLRVVAMVKCEKEVVSMRMCDCGCKKRVPCDCDGDVDWEER